MNYQELKDRLLKKYNILLDKKHGQYYTIATDGRGWIYSNTITNYSNIDEVMDYYYKLEYYS